jgi:hypothetical protein
MMHPIGFRGRSKIDLLRVFGISRKCGYNLRKGYLYSKLNSHLIFFRKTKGEEIEVLRVLLEQMGD